MSKFSNYKQNRCNDCGLEYPKLVHQTCRLCNMIHNIGPYYIIELILCESKYDQNTIIKKTVEFILKYKKSPVPNDIDPQVKLINLPIYKYNKNANHKIFVTNLFKFSYIIKTYFGDGYYDYKRIRNPENYIFDDRIIQLNNI